MFYIRFFMGFGPGTLQAAEVEHGGNHRAGPSAVAARLPLGPRAAGTIHIYM